jgi:hypothetical protein
MVLAELDVTDDAVHRDRGKGVADLLAVGHGSGLGQRRSRRMQPVIRLRGKAVRLFLEVRLVLVAECLDARRQQIWRERVVLRHAGQVLGIQPLQEAIGTHRQRADQVEGEPGIADLLDGERARLFVHQQHDGLGIRAADVGDVAGEIHLADVEIADVAELDGLRQRCPHAVDAAAAGVVVPGNEG